ncbi:hypothetical protein DY000_02022347 [Brassica cretica]|uniref:Uncharacterized protein n=1 Tax=Brassica cretica TaxID=69181 RepID=A0ABQ7EEB6_BRACR|nr:hypothetical protein DY000_02022347 [Brassica cretica]
MVSSSGILRTGVLSRGDPEAGVLPGVWRNSIPEYLPQQFSPYYSISSSNSGNNLRTQVNRSCSFAAGFPQAGHRSSSPAIPGSIRVGTVF